MVELDCGAALTAALRQDIAHISAGYPPAGASARRALARLHDVAEHFPAFMALLAEPWLDAALPQDETLLQCARIHLYARVLDDALDEHLPVDRHHLLRAQPVFWQALYALGARYPLHQQDTAALIAETVAAVAADDQRRAPQYWGSKNHHLLLAPMLLTTDAAVYCAVRPGLSALIAVAQAREELQQGALSDAATAQALAAALATWLAPQNLAALQQHGWPRAAQRLLSDGRALRQQIENRTGYWHEVINQ